MLSIDKLNISLPAAYKDQAHNIANQVAQVLADMDQRGITDKKSVVVPAIKIEQGSSVDRLIIEIANAIKKSLGES